MVRTKIIVDLKIETKRGQFVIWEKINQSQYKLSQKATSEMGKNVRISPQFWSMHFNGTGLFLLEKFQSCLIQ